MKITKEKTQIQCFGKWYISHKCLCKKTCVTKNMNNTAQVIKEGSSYLHCEMKELGASNFTINSPVWFLTAVTDDKGVQKTHVVTRTRNFHLRLSKSDFDLLYHKKKLFRLWFFFIHLGADSYRVGFVSFGLNVGKI